MSDDDKKYLPVSGKPPAVTAQGHDPAYPQSPLQNRGLTGRLWSRFVSKLNTKTIEANAAEVRAHTDYANARGELAQSMLRADRAVFDYVEHRDDYLRDDHEDHLNRMEERAHQRELDRIRRAETMRALKADSEQSAMQRNFDHKIAVQNNEAELAEAQWRAAHAQWGRDAFQQTLGYRRERLDHLYKTGALEKEIDRLLSESLRDEQLATQNRNGGISNQDGATLSRLAVLEQMLAEVDQELELAHATHASDSNKAALYDLRSRLTAKLEALRRDAASGPSP
jgi:hypothetical protein